MKQQRQQYSAEFKAKVALEALKGARTVNEIGAHYEVHPTQVVQWKKQALDHLPSAFESGRKAPERAAEELQNALYQQIGQLKVELDWVKKKAGLLG
jgi:transposase-like protein